jgi:L-amino acid N-acyltransferase YncA/2-polyprenyl-3-methyl-5-hydroxy-6-metoxy-1,4-benzoquinol methylase
MTSDDLPDGSRDEIRDRTVDRYSGLARLAQAGGIALDQETGDGCFGAAAYDGDAPESALRASLGCGNPLAVADLKEGDTVLDLGSGGGLDVVLSARRVGPTGKAYGLDASPDMLTLARTNAIEAGATNVEFLAGHIEDIPLPDAGVDVVISNCVINLSADKPRVLAEAFRVLRPGGRFGVSDVIADDDLDPAQRTAAEQQVGCANGTLTATEYRNELLAAGFTTVTITPTHQAGPGLQSAIVQAAKPTAPHGVTIRPMRAADADEILAIYQAGLDTGNASFETAAPTWTSFDAAKLPLHRHVATDTTTGRILGWIAATPVSDRCVYAGVIEHSIYVALDQHGRGIGAALLHALIDSSQTAGIWTIQSGLFPDNAASLRLHHNAGFRTVGTRHRIGRHHGHWRDVILIERRSAVTG